MLRGWEAQVRWFGRHTRVGFARTRFAAVDAAACASVEGKFFFSWFCPIQSNSVWFSPKWSKTGPKSVRYGPKFLLKKKNLKIRSKHTVLSADFKGKTLKSSQFSLLSIITLKLVYVYHYMKKKMLSNM